MFKFLSVVLENLYQFMFPVVFKEPNDLVGVNARKVQSVAERLYGVTDGMTRAQLLGQENFVISTISGSKRVLKAIDHIREILSIFGRIEPIVVLHDQILLHSV